MKEKFLLFVMKFKKKKKSLQSHIFDNIGLKTK